MQGLLTSPIRSGASPIEALVLVNGGEAPLAVEPETLSKLCRVLNFVLHVGNPALDLGSKSLSLPSLIGRWRSTTAKHLTCVGIAQNYCHVLANICLALQNIMRLQEPSNDESLKLFHAPVGVLTVHSKRVVTCLEELGQLG